MDINALRVRESDGGMDKLAAVAEWPGAKVFDPMERLALEMADCMTLGGQGVDDRLFERLKATFTEKQIVELAAAIAFENFRSRLNPALGIEAQGFCLRHEK